MLSRLLAEDWPGKVARAKPAVGGTRKLLTTTAVCGIRKNLTKPAVGGKRQKITPVVKESIASSVHESDWDHWQRHSPQPESHNCGRCNFIREKAEFLRNYPWLEPRPTFMGDDWKFGCNACRWLMLNAKKREQHSGRRGCQVRACAFSRFQVSCDKKMSVLHDRLQAHSREAGHRMAVSAVQRASHFFHS